MNRSFMIAILPWVFSGLQNGASAQQTKVGVVLYASKNENKIPASSPIDITGTKNDRGITTIPFEHAYYDNFYGTESFDVYAGVSGDLSLVYLKVATSSAAPISVSVINMEGQEVSKFTRINRALVIGYGYKPGIYFIHICQGKNEMVLRFSKGV